jgi:nitrous oxidase accessory protein
MSAWQRRSAWALAAALSIGALGFAARNLRPSWHAPAEHAAPKGPVALALPAGKTYAKDSKELASLLGDPQGPLEIWLGDTIYSGDFSIRRPVTVRGTGKSVLDGSGSGTVLSIEADYVNVENLTLRHSGRSNTKEDAAIKATGRRIRISNVRTEDTLFGIQLVMCKSCLIEGVHIAGTSGDELRGDGIKLWEAHESVVRDSLVENVRDVVIWYSRHVALERLVVKNSRYGAHFMYAHDSSSSNCRFLENEVGIFVMYSSRVRAERNVLAGAKGAAGMGFGFKESESVDLGDNWVVANTTGIYLDHTPRSPDQEVHFHDNVLALNDVALRTHGGNRGIRFEGNDLQGNGEVGEVDGGGDMLSMNFAGNYWSDYAGYDLDRDGRGDVPYEVKRLSGEITDAHPSLRFFRGTAAMGLVNTIAEAFPTFSHRKLLVDSSPLFDRGQP